MIRAVIFDVGGVLVRTHDQTPRRRWEARLGLPPGGAEAIVFNSESGNRAQRGELSEAEHWAWVAGELGLGEADLTRFRDDFFAGDRLDAALVDLIRGLRPAYTTAIISNAFDGLHRALREKFLIADAFDLIVGSAVEGVMKPDPEIYRRTLRRLECDPAAAVFVDDAPANVEGARRVGMAAVHFRPGLDVADALRALGVEVPA